VLTQGASRPLSLTPQAGGHSWGERGIQFSSRASISQGKGCGEEQTAQRSAPASARAAAAHDPRPQAPRSGDLDPRVASPSPRCLRAQGSRGCSHERTGEARLPSSAGRVAGHRVGLCARGVPRGEEATNRRRGARLRWTLGIKHGQIARLGRGSGSGSGGWGLPGGPVADGRAQAGTATTRATTRAAVGAERAAAAAPRGRGVRTSPAALQTVVAEAQHGRQVADVADGQAQRLDLGEALAGGRHGGRQEAAQLVQGAGERAHAQFLALAGALPLPAAQAAAASPRRRGAGGWTAVPRVRGRGWGAAAGLVAGRWRPPARGQKPGLGAQRAQGLGHGSRDQTLRPGPGAALSPARGVKWPLPGHISTSKRARGLRGRSLTL
jgi:hypothetical protein